MLVKKATIFYVLYLAAASVLLIFSAAKFGIAGEGEPAKTTIGSVPNGYKLVAVDDECRKKDPCEKDKREISNLKAEIKRLQKAIVDLPECEVCQKRPKQEVKTVYIDKIKEMPVEKRVEVEKPFFKKNIFRVIGAVGQDGIVTESSPKDEYAEDAAVYWNGLGGLGYTRFFDDTIGVGVFGMAGGINKTIGASFEIAF